jgi:hypothetical protein
MFTTQIYNNELKHEKIHYDININKIHEIVENNRRVLREECSTLSVNDESAKLRFYIRKMKHIIQNPEDFPNEDVRLYENIIVNLKHTSHFPLFPKAIYKDNPKAIGFSLLLGLPPELIEHICSFLKSGDIVFSYGKSDTSTAITQALTINDLVLDFKEMLMKDGFSFTTTWQEFLNIISKQEKGIEREL